MHRTCKKLCDKHDKGMIEKLMNGQIHIHYFHLKFCIEVTVGIAAGLIFTYVSQLIGSVRPGNCNNSTLSSNSSYWQVFCMVEQF